MGLTGCVTQPIQQKSALELQAIQVKEFSTNHKVAFTSVLSVFQDLGYVVNSASLETGLITAKSPTIQEFVPFVGQRMTDEKANAFVEQIGTNRTKIRLSFVKSQQTSSGYGMRGERDTPIQDPGAYQDAFTKIQQSIFVRSNTN
ncbi:MAG: hypothetical protein DCF26_14130 [Burkholderiales bacterium]|nr:MAG: hypothetical protein DCF26_14130 [Burkholderiales bacterium]